MKLDSATEINPKTMPTAINTMYPPRPEACARTRPATVTARKPVNVETALLVAVNFPRTEFGTYSCCQGVLAVMPIERSTENTATIAVTNSIPASGPVLDTTMGVSNKPAATTLRSPKEAT